MRRLNLVAMTVLSAIVLSAAPAQAASHTYRDPKRDTDGGASGNDITATTVVNGAMVGVKIRHRDLERSASDIQFKTMSRDGQAITVFGDLKSGTVLVYDESFATIECVGATVTRSLGQDRTSLMVPRSCVLGDTSKLKLRPRVQWNRSGSKGDWSFNKGTHFSPWVNG